MRFKARAFAAAASLAAAVAAAGCAPTTQVHGYVPSAEDLAQVRVGADDRTAVEGKLGLPSSTGLLGDSAWYYVQSTFENYTYNPARLVDRKVLVLTFDQRGIVSAIDTYGIEDGRIVNLQTRTTETGGRRLGVLEQLFGNILNLDAEAINAANQ